MRAALVLVLAALGDLARRRRARRSGPTPATQARRLSPSKAGQTAVGGVDGDDPGPRARIDEHLQRRRRRLGRPRRHDHAAAEGLRRRSTRNSRSRSLGHRASHPRAVNDEVLTVNRPRAATPVTRRPARSGSSDGRRRRRRRRATTSRRAPTTCSRAASSTRAAALHRHADDRRPTHAAGVDLARLRRRAGPRLLGGRPGRPAARRGGAADRDRPRRQHLHLRPDGLLERARTTHRSPPTAATSSTCSAPRRAASRAPAAAATARSPPASRRTPRQLPVRVRGPRRAERLHDVDLGRQRPQPLDRRARTRNGGITSNGALADRQWMTFTDDHTVLLSYNQQSRATSSSEVDRRRARPTRRSRRSLPRTPTSPGRSTTSRAAHVVYMPWTRASRSTSPSRRTAAHVGDC